ncbi:hypothetical protein KFU94_07930 [Chloroflexi bacterium TSY]|nr:hypothetical protein [Chloroflexi bacterium TSY]
MFSKSSRYSKLPDVVTIDAEGRSLRSKAARLLPIVAGTFRHTVEAGDRLDHLAYQYYKQPRKWWRVCDANPEFMSPLALLGQEPIVSEAFPLTWTDEMNPPPWAALRQVLMGIVGVLDLQVKEEAALVEEKQMVDSEAVTMFVDTFQRTVIVTYNEMNVQAVTIAEAIGTTGFVVGESVRAGRVGKSILIPPNSIR